MIEQIGYLSKLIIPLFILLILVYGIIKKVKIYEAFVDGAKEGFGIGIRIIPYLVAILIAVRGFQASGAFNFLKYLMTPVFAFLKVPVEVLGMAIIKPLSGSASIGVLVDIIKTAGADSLAARMSAVIMGSTETTFYILAVYLGSVGIRKTKYLVPVCIISDIIGMLIAIVVVKLLF